MEDPGNKTIMCGVLFLDIVEYSRKPVAEQIALKERFIDHLARALRDVPMADRLILDTGDGAAISFLGDAGDALNVALELRDRILDEESSQSPPLRVRMAINLGPVRLVREVNGQPNIVGDGISVAQRIIGFAESGQILASRAYCEAVPQISAQHPELFSYMGSRTDKHVREHEIYCVTGRMASDSGAVESAPMASTDVGLIPRLQQVLGTREGKLVTLLMVAISLIIIVVFGSGKQDDVSAVPTADQVLQAPATAIQGGKAPAESGDAASEMAATQVNDRRTDKDTRSTVSKSKESEPPRTESSSAARRTVAEPGILVICRSDRARVFVDFKQKGSVDHGVLKLSVSPGRHTVVVKHDTGILHQQKVNLAQGENVSIKPDFCN